MKYISIFVALCLCLCGNLSAQNTGAENNGRKVGASAKAAPTEIPAEKAQANPENVTDDRDIPGKTREPRTDIFLPEAIDELRDELYNSASIPQVVAEVEALKTVILDIVSEQQKLKRENETLRKQINACCNAESQGMTIKDAYLMQNAPNPFTTQTKLDYFVPEMVTKASIEVHDLKGITVKSFNLDIKGFASLNLDGSQLPAGTYIYYLVVDDELVDSKVMIIN